MNMEHFSYSHLPPDLAAISKPFHDLAHSMLNTLPNCDERIAGLRKLLEAKDCAVRARLEDPRRLHSPCQPSPPDATARQGYTKLPLPDDEAGPIAHDLLLELNITEPTAAQVQQAMAAVRECNGSRRRALERLRAQMYFDSL